MFYKGNLIRKNWLVVYYDLLEKAHPEDPLQVFEVKLECICEYYQFFVNMAEFLVKSSHRSIINEQ